MANKRIMKQIKEEAGSKSKTSLDTLKPLIPEKEKKTETLTTRMTPSCKTKLKALAEVSNMTIADVLDYLIMKA